MKAHVPRHLRLYGSLLAGGLLFFVLPMHWPR